MHFKKLWTVGLGLGLGLLAAVAPAQIVPYWTPGGAEIGTSLEQYDYDHQVVVPDGTGGAFVAWVEFHDPDHFLYVQKLAVDGTALWGPGGVLVCQSDEFAHQPFFLYTPCQLASDGEGGVIVAWCDERTYYTTAFVQRIDQQGDKLWGQAGVECWAGDGGWTLEMTNIVGDGCGGALVFGYGWWGGLYLQKVDSDGNLLLGSEFGYFEAIPGELPGNAPGPFHAVSDGAGGAYLAWATEYGDIRLTRFDRDMDYVWEYTQQIITVCDQADQQSSPRLAPDGSGGVIVSWYDSRVDEVDGQLPGPVAIFSQRIDHLGYVYDDPECTSCIWSANPDGIQVSPPIEVHWFADWGPMVTPCVYGASMYVWADESTGDFDVYAQRLEGNGWKSLAWGAPPDGLPVATLAGTDQFMPVLASDGDRGALVAWRDDRGTQPAIYIQHINHFKEGDLQWIELEGATDGDPVCAQDEAQDQPILAAAGNILTWVDQRDAATTGPSILAQKYEPVETYLRYIDGESALGSVPVFPASLEYECFCGTYYSDVLEGTLTDNGVTYTLWRQAKPGFLSTVGLTMEDEAPRAGERSLTFRAEALPDEGWCVKQYSKVYFPEHAIPFNEVRYNAFSLMIPADSENPLPETTYEICGGETATGPSWFNLVSWGQICGEADVAGGILALNLTTELDEQDNEVLKLRFQITNEDVQGLAIYDEVCPKGVWQDFAVGYRFDPAGCGWVQLLRKDPMDHDYELVAEHTGKLGQPLHTLDDLAANAQAIGAPSFGIARMQIPRTCEACFDEIRYGRTLAEVMPGQMDLVPVLYSPQDGFTFTYDPIFHILFKWYMVEGCTAYVFQFDDNEDFDSPYETAWTQCNVDQGTCSTSLDMPDPGTYYWRVRTVDYAVWSDTWSITVKQTKPTKPDPHPHKPVARCYPNPLNPATTISFALPRREHVLLQIFDVQGRLVTTLVDEPRAAGSHEAVWRGTGATGAPVASGLYFYRFQAGETVIHEKLLLLK